MPTSALGSDSLKAKVICPMPAQMLVPSVNWLPAQRWVWLLGVCVEWRERGQVAEMPGQDLL